MPPGVTSRRGHGARAAGPEMRNLSYVEAIREATDLAMARDPAVVVFGLDVDDPRAIQGTTRGACSRSMAPNACSARHCPRTR